MWLGNQGGYHDPATVLNAYRLLSALCTSIVEHVPIFAQLVSRCTTQFRDSKIAIVPCEHAYNISFFQERTTQDLTMAKIINAPDLPSDDEEDQDYDPTRYKLLAQ